MLSFDIATVYLVIGLLYLVLPATVWLILARLRSQSAALWCLGGGLFGLSLILFALRKGLPPWLTYSVANYCLWTGNLLMLYALRLQLGKVWRASYMALFVVVCAGLFELFRQVLQIPALRFGWSIIVLLGMYLAIVSTSLEISRTQKLQSPKWLLVVYVLTVLILSVRLVRVFVGLTPADVSGGGIDGVLTVTVGLLISVIGNFSFVSIFLERASKTNQLQAAQKAREEESQKLGAQIAQLERQRTFGVMSYSFAHELSQPLTAVLMDVQSAKNSLARSDPKLDEVQQSLDDIEHSTLRTVQLIERIRAFVRPSENVFELVDLVRLVKDARQLLAYERRKLNVNFSFEIEDADLRVEGDRVQLSQIVMNVYRNAMQAMQDQVEKDIHVTLERDGNHVVLRVRDSGPGLSTDIKDLVGTPFMTTKSEGMGVGFSISRMIAENHGGRLTISNVVEGRGAVVELNLPAASPARA